MRISDWSSDVCSSDLAEFLSIVVACIGTSLSAYIYTWQSNQEVEEHIAMGRRGVRQREGASRSEMKRTSRDVLIGMIFANIILYFIILSTGVTLHPAGPTEIETAAQAAAALEPLAGAAAKIGRASCRERVCQYV